MSAWISPEDRRQAFDSTASTDETSAVEAANPKRTRYVQMNAILTVAAILPNNVLPLTEISIYNLHSSFDKAS